MRRPVVLVVDDDPTVRFAFEKTLASMNVDVITASDGAEAVKKVSECDPAVVFMDVSMPGMSGLEALERIRERCPETQVVIITGQGSMKTAIRAMQLGAYDYLTKPVDVDKVRITGRRAIELHYMRRRIGDLEKRLDDVPLHDDEIVGEVPVMQEMFKSIGVISTTPNTTNVLILGETGTGKELVAKAIHNNGTHRESPFLAINCTALPENLLESELFGHEKGAYTGADRRTQGKFEVARDGTVFLDEIGDIGPVIQKKLLRVIQERTFERLGGHESIRLEARIIAATHHDLQAEVERGNFREDLFYRLNVMQVVVPPLRGRGEDVRLLTSYFVSKFAKRFGRNIASIAPEVFDALAKYEFPGNVRELENVVERAVAMVRGDLLTLDMFPVEVVGGRVDLLPDIPLPGGDFNTAKQKVIASFEHKYLRKLLRAAAGNITHAAAEAGIERQSFQRLMKKHGITASEFKRPRGEPGGGTEEKP